MLIFNFFSTLRRIVATDSQIDGEKKLYNVTNEIAQILLLALGELHLGNSFSL
jgi:hypothetical protein